MPTGEPAKMRRGELSCDKGAQASYTQEGQFNDVWSKSSTVYVIRYGLKSAMLSYGGGRRGRPGQNRPP